MFYKYSDFSTDRIMEDSNYKTICEKFLKIPKLLKNEDMRKKMEQILFEGGVGNYSINNDIIRKNNPEIERGRRVAYASLLAITPETFDAVTENNITLFHGTNANALPKILKYGLNSVDESTKKGIKVLTGEPGTRINGKRDFISLTDDPDIALDYSQMSPLKNSDHKLNFEVVLGISAENAKKLNTTRIVSDTREIGVVGNIPPEYITFIGVPKSKVNYVRKLVNNDKVKVVAIEPSKRFHYKDSIGHISYNDKKANELLREQKHPDKKFSIEEMKNLTFGRTKSRIQDITRKVKELFNKGKDKLINKRKDDYYERS